MWALTETVTRFPAVVQLMRPKHWAKNLFLFIPLFFAGQFFNTTALLLLLLGFLCFSFVASSIYIINDLQDIEADRNHPTKRNRPLASGLISPPAGVVLASFLALTGLVGAFMLNTWFFVVLLTYFLLNLAYSYGLKQIAILDIFIIAMGFVLRVVGGGMLVDVPLTQWMLIMIFLLALFLALAKRRDDVLIFAESGKHVRKASQNYNKEFLSSCLTMVAAVIMVAYVMYSVSEEVSHRLGTTHLYITAIFVIAGMMRYLQITLVENNSSSPTKILYRDNFIRFTILGWIISFYIILYIPRLDL